MKKNIASAITLLFAASLIACGRPSTSRVFELDGVGDPRTPSGNPIPGKFGGTMSLANWEMFPPSYSTAVFGQPLPAFSVNQAYFNATDIAGLGGLDLLLIGIAAPPRIASGQGWACYMDPAAFPLLGGELVTRDVGRNVDFDFESGFEARISRDKDTDVIPDDLLVWFGIPQDNQTGDILLLPNDEDVDIDIRGGTLANLGYPIAAPLKQEVLHFPPALGTSGAQPTVNNAPMSAMIPENDKYRIRWDRAPTSGDSDEDLLGVEIVLTVYGPNNFGTVAAFDVTGDVPFFNRIAHLVCLVNDAEEEFTVFQSQVDPAETDPHAPWTIDDLVALAMSTGKYATTTEDVNGNGTLDERPCGGIPPTPCVEDGNRNHVLDKLYGISLYVNRRTERVFELPTGPSGNGRSKVLISGNDVKVSKLEYLSAPAQCNNGIDDDGDGDVDFGDDAQCADGWDNDETS